MSPKKVNRNNATVSEKDLSGPQSVREQDGSTGGNSIGSSIREITIIESMESFLEENGGADVDPKVLRVLAETLSKRINYTSPGTLQDVTMDNSYGAISYRSMGAINQPNYQGNISPTSQGRSVREFEEQMAALRKDNFNLKLKLYFIEETVPGFQQAMNNGQDVALKQLIDKKVENEMLRKEVKEKQDLLKDAVQAMNHLESMLKEKDEKHQMAIEELNHKINFYEMERELQQHSNSLLEVGNSKAESDGTLEEEMNDLKNKLQQGEERIQDLEKQINQLDSILIQRDETIKNLEDKVSELKVQNDNLSSTLRQKSEDLKTSEDQQMRQALQDLRVQMADKICMLDETEDKLKQKTQMYQKALRTIQKLILNVGNQQKEIEKLKSQSKNYSSNSTMPKLSNQTTSGLSGLEAMECSAFIKSVSDSEAALNHQSETVINDLHKQLQQARTDAENADRWRKECADVCAILTNRLEELAGFLNSLLKQKDVLGILAADRCKAIRKAVDRSLDLSKSLNMTLSISGLSLTDQSLAHLSNLSEILGCYENDDGGENTFNSHLDGTRLSFELTKSERHALRKESAEKRKNNDCKKERRSLPLHLPPQENQSESEAWSEPDRLVSMARIGLDENSASLSKELTKKKTHSSESDCESLNHSRNNSKTRAHDRITQLEQIIAERDERILDIQCKLVEADNRLKKENLRVLEMTNRIESLEERNDELQHELEILESQIQASETQHNQSLLLKEIEEKSSALELLRNEIDDAKLNHEIALTCAHEELKEKLQTQKEELEALQEKNIKDLQLQHKIQLERDYIALLQYEEIKAQLLELQRQYIEAQRTIDNLTDNEHELKQTLLDIEMEARSLKKQLDESTLQASKAIMDRSKAFNEKLQFEKHVEELKLQIAAFESERHELQEHVQKLEEQLEATEALKAQNVIIENGNEGEAVASGYTSEEVPNVFSDASASSSNKVKLAQRALKRQNNSSSPDLGIESDAGRMSGTETARTLPSQQYQREEGLETGLDRDDSKEGLDSSTEKIDPINNMNGAEDENPLAMTTTATKSSIIHDCAKVEQENTELRRKLSRTKKAFEDTYEKLRVANQRKAQIEKDIKNQILKTHNVLRNVRTNMENEL